LEFSFSFSSFVVVILILLFVKLSFSSELLINSIALIASFASIVSFTSKSLLFFWKFFSISKLKSEFSVLFMFMILLLLLLLLLLFKGKFNFFSVTLGLNSFGFFLQKIFYKFSKKKSLRIFKKIINKIFDIFLLLKNN